MAEEENIQNATPSPQPEKAKSRPWWKRIIRFFVWTFGIFIFLVLVLVGLTYIYQDEVKKYVIDEVNKRVNTQIIIDPKDIDITIVKTFPDVSVIFKNISALDAIPSDKRDTLVKAESISLGFNIMDLFHGNYSIHNIRMENGQVNLRIDEKGKDNYHFLKETTDTAQIDTSHVNFELNKITLKNVVCSYSDKKEKTAYIADFHTLDFTGDFGQEKYDFGTEADFTVQKIMFGKSAYFKGNPGAIDLLIAIDNQTGTYIVSKGNLKIADLAINVSGTILEKKKNYLLDLLVKGDDIDLPAALSLLPSSYTSDLSDIKSTGEFYIDGSIKGLMGDSATPEVIAKFGIGSGATLSKKDVELNDITLDGIFSNVKGNDGVQINSFKASSAKSKYSGSFLLKNFDHPHYSTKLSGHIDMSELQSVLSIDTIEKTSGTLDLEFEASGSPAKGNSLTPRDFRAFKTSGSATFTNGVFKLKGQAFTIDSINGKLVFDGNNVGAQNFSANAGNSDLQINASVRNLLGYLFTEKEVLDINGKLVSKNLDLNALLNSEKAQTENLADTAYRLVMPERLRLNLSTAVHHVLFRKFEATDLNGEVRLNNQRLTADPIRFYCMDGSISGSGMIDGTREDSLLITCNADITSVSIYKLFYQLENFGQEGADTTITYNNVRGNLTSHLNFASLWGNDLNVNEKKIYTNADVTITNGELINFKPLEVLSKFIKLDELKDIKFKSLHNNIEIKNRLINIPKMEINSSALNLTMSGTHSFDDTVDYHFIVDMDEILSKKWITRRPQKTEYGVEEDDGGHRTRIFLNMKGYLDDDNITHYDRKGAVQAFKEDMHAEKQNLKSILQDEFNWFKKDKDKKEDRKKEDEGKFILQQDDPPKSKDKKGKGDENLDDGDDYK
jgi:hypothetical protein